MHDSFVHARVQTYFGISRDAEYLYSSHFEKLI